MIESRGEDRLTERELVSSIRLLIIAGHETTVNLLGNGMLALLRDPAQADLLRERPELVPGAVEEFLRYESPVERATARFASQDVRIGETLIPRGSMVYVAPEDLTYQQSVLMRGLTRLPIRFQAAA